MDPQRRRDLLARYAEGPGLVGAFVEGLTEADLDRRPDDGGWTPREVIHHLADSEMTSAIRLRRLLAEDSPTIHGYDEMEFSRRLHYGARPIGPSIVAFRGARESTATLLEAIGDEEWDRSGTHDESGPYSVGTWLEIYGRHAHDHLEQMQRAVAGRP